MRKTIKLILLVALCSLGRGVAQNVIPLSEADDTAHIMSKGYWQLWNDDVQRRIDADIERNRKADATLQLGDVKRGSTVEIRQVKSAFYVGAQAFNFNQLGTHERNLKYRELWGTLFNSVTVPFTGRPTSRCQVKRGRAISMWTRRLSGTPSRCQRTCTSGEDLRLNQLSTL